MRNYKAIYRKVRIYLSFPFQDQLLLIKASFLLLSLRIGLKLIPFNKLYLILKLILRKPLYSYHNYPAYTRRIIWSVEKCGNYLLRTKCLAQALAVHILLNRKRIINEIEIGFVKNKSKVSAHAWVKTENEILTGGDANLNCYFRLSLKKLHLSLITSLTYGYLYFNY